MGLIKEPIEVDFQVDPRKLTKKEQLAISEFIKQDKAQRTQPEKKQIQKQHSKRAKTNA